MVPVRLDSGVAGVKSQGQSSDKPRQAQGNGSFQNALQVEIGKNTGVKLSAHAQKRFAERNVQLGEEEQARIGSGIDKIQAKGADKSLVLMDDLALVVSAKNRVVITAVDSANARDSVFTNIESAVIV